MRLIFFADSHGNSKVLRDIVLRHKHEAELFLFLGDGDGDLREIHSEFPEISFSAVKGNNDIFSEAPLSQVITYKGITLYMCHGHQYSLSGRTDQLRETARKNGASAALFGHSHMPLVDYRDGIYVLNPGSVARPRGGSKKSYGALDITPSGIVPVIMEV